MDQTTWLIGCMILDVLVIGTNITEQFFIIRGWKYLDRIDHLLLSLSVSDLIFGLSTLTIDSWYLSREILSLKNGNYINATSCFSIQFNQNTTEHFLNEYHKIMSCATDGLFIFTVFVSVFHVMALAIERLYAVRFPHRYYIFTLFKTKFLTIAMIWGVGVILTVIQVGAFGMQARDNSIARAVLLALITISVFVLYSTVAYFLFEQQKSLTKEFSSESYIDLNRLRRITVICLFIGVSYVVCTVCMVINYFNQLYFNNKWLRAFLPPGFSYVSSFMVTLNSIINPCIYFVKLYYNNKGPNLRRGGDSARLVDNNNRHGHTITTIVEGRGSWRMGSGSIVKSKSNDFLMKPEVSSEQD